MPKVSAELAASIAAAVAQGFDDQLAYTQQLVRTGGQRGQEFEVQDLVYDRFSERGYNPVKLEMDENLLSQHEGAGRFSDEHSKAPVVIGVHEPRVQAKDGKSLILNAHIDVVPTGPIDLWTRDPYSGDIEGDRLYGRGGADMRAGSAANLFALDALRRLGLQPASKVILESVVEEESTGNGTLMTHLKGYRADAVIIPEPMDEKLVRANTGVLWFQIEVKGIPVHVRDMSTGTNAIDACWRVVGGLRELEKEWNEKKIGRLHFENENHPLSRLPLFSLGTICSNSDFSTDLNVAKVNAGDWASSVPAWCRIDFRIAIFPGVSAKAAAEEIEAKVKEVACNDAFLSKNKPTVTWNGFFSEGYVLEPNSEAEKTLQWAHQQATGDELQSFTTAAYLDTRIHSLYDKIPALCYGPISSNIHGFDEWVSISSLKRITTAIALYIAEWCGVESIE
jgi:acetylornithine deacetylase